MKQKRVGLCIFLLFCLMTSISYIAESPPSVEWLNTTKSYMCALDDDILITGDEDWESQGWPGNGTYSAPYVISGFRLNLIRISNSSQWFVIQELTVLDHFELTNVTNGVITHSNFLTLYVVRSLNITISTNEQTYGRVVISESNDIVIESNSMDNYAGIYYETCCLSICLSKNIEITNNSIQDSYTGIEIQDSNNCQIERNFISRCGIYNPATTITYTPPPITPPPIDPYQTSQSSCDQVSGEAIRLQNCTETNIVNNSFSTNNGRGAKIVNCSNFSIIKNDITMNHGGMLVQDCEIFNISTNVIDYGLIIQSSLSGIIEDNIFHHSGIVIQGNLVCLLHSISNNTLDNYPIIYISNNNSYSLLTQTIAQLIVVNCTEVVIQETSVLNNGNIQIVSSSDCRFQYISSSSVAVIDSSEIVLEESSFFQWSDYGVVIDSSSLISITNSTVTCGIQVKNNSNMIFLIENVHSSVRASAIKVESGSSNVFIENNDIRQCGRVSSYFWYYNYYPAIDIRGSDCRVKGNIIVDNYGIGIALQGTNISVYFNIIARNGQGNALDHGTNNTWDDNVSRGNTWGDYIGFGYYSIRGDAGSVDRYPSLSSEFLEQSVITVWGLMIGAPLVFVILVGIVVILYKRSRNQISRPINRGRVGLG